MPVSVYIDSDPLPVFMGYYLLQRLAPQGLYGMFG